MSKSPQTSPSKGKFYKFLDYNLASYYNKEKEFYYPAPTFKDGEWIPTEWVEEKDCVVSEEPCGRGLHLMKVLIPKYHPYRGNCYEAEGEGLLGQDDEKARFRKVRLLKPVPPKEIFKPYANLRNANLRNANISYVNLIGADLRNADISGANLWSADISYANLSYANLSGASISCANLRNANISHINLSYASLMNTNLRNTNLNYANLNYANLSYADLRNADLSYASIRNANLSGANLSYANLRNANLIGANLRNANLSGANLCGAKNLDISRDIDEAYWNKLTKVNDDSKKLLSKKKFLDEVLEK